MVNRAELKRMQHNVETFCSRVRALESSLETMRGHRDDRDRAPQKGEATPVVLTAREITILRMIAAGHDNAYIAASLNFGLGTIKLHVREILEKLRVSTRTEAAVQAVRLGLIG